MILDCRKSVVKLHPALISALGARDWKLEIATSSPCTAKPFIRSSPQTIDVYIFSVLGSKMFFSLSTSSVLSQHSGWESNYGQLRVNLIRDVAVPLSLQRCALLLEHCKCCGVSQAPRNPSVLEHFCVFAKQCNTLQTHNYCRGLICSRQQFGFVEVFQVSGGDYLIYFPGLCSLIFTQFKFSRAFPSFGTSEQHIKENPCSLLWRTWRGYIDWKLSSTCLIQVLQQFLNLIS